MMQAHTLPCAMRHCSQLITDYFHLQCSPEELEREVEESWCVDGCHFGVQVPPYLKDLAIISDDTLQVQKKSDLLYQPCSVYSACPLGGKACFEVQVSLLSLRPVGHLMIGLTRLPRHYCMDQHHQAALPYESSNFCVWHNGAVWNNFSVVHTKVSYGKVHLTELKQQDRVGLAISLAGDLAFYVNGECQGLAARNVYLESCDVYAVATMLESCDSVSVVRSGKNCMGLLNAITYFLLLFPRCSNRVSSTPSGSLCGCTLQLAPHS